MGNMYFWNHLMSPWFPHSPAENSIMSPAQRTGRRESFPYQVCGEETWGWWQSANVIAAWHSKVKGVWPGGTVVYLRNRWLGYPYWKRRVSWGYHSWCATYGRLQRPPRWQEGSVSPWRQKIIYCLVMVEVGWLWLVDRICLKCDDCG